ncbi:MAG: hypothetical protein JWL65_5383 [Gammaproteobacteria bacterium]|nr:hypothetical protein [Gammaproteobacteria bacterium]
MKKIIRNVTTYDDLLHALPPGKVLVTGACWTGTLAPLIDSTLMSISALSTGFTSGNVLHAQPTPAELSLGRLWVGSLRDQIAQAANDTRSETHDKIDVTEALRAVESVRNAMGVPKPVFSHIADSIRTLRRARDEMTQVTALSQGAETNSDNAGRVYCDRSKQNTRDSLARIRAAAAAQWNDNSSNSSAHPVDGHARSNGSVVTASRDEMVPTPIVPSRGSQIAGRGGYRGDFSKAISPAEQSQINREYWDKQK